MSLRLIPIFSETLALGLSIASLIGCLDWTQLQKVANSSGTCNDEQNDMANLMHWVDVRIPLTKDVEGLR